MAGLKQLNWASEGVGATAAALVDLSTVAGNKISNPPWVKFQSAGWVNFPSAPTINGYLGDRGLSLRQGTIVDATLINAPSSTKNKDGKRDPEMHQTKKGNQYYFGMKAHIGADDESGLVHSVVGTAANVADVTQVDKLLHGDENVVCADAGYTGVEKRPEHEGREVIWQVAARRSTYKKLDKRSVLYKAKRKIEKAKAQVRAKVEHPFRVIKRQFGYTKVRFRGLAKNTAQLVTLFALSNLWMARRHLLTNAGEVRL